MRIYRFDNNDIYTGNSEAFLDHNDNPLFPPNSTLIEPPVTAEHEVAVWNSVNERWQIEKDYLGFVYYLGEGEQSITIEEIGIEPPEGHSTEYIPTIEEVKEKKCTEVKQYFEDKTFEFEDKIIIEKIDNIDNLLKYCKLQEERGEAFPTINLECDDNTFLEILSLENLNLLYTQYLETIANAEINKSNNVKAINELTDKIEIENYSFENTLNMETVGG